MVKIDKLCPEWQKFILQQKQLDYFIKLEQQLVKIKQTNIVYPEPNNYFKALELTPATKVKVVILGQDPYHQAKQANGLCFSVPQGIKIPPSLNNIFKALSFDLQVPKPSHGDLSNWSKQGVLLLNTVLTVSHNQANSHQNIGWQIFTKNLLTLITKKHNNLIFLLWGKQAQSYGYLLNNHNKLLAPHPSPLSAHKGFITCKHFSQANKILSLHKQNPIVW